MFIGIIFVLGMVLVNRMIIERASKKLSEEQKARLVDSFSSQRIWSVGFILIVLAGFFMITEFKLANPALSLAVYFFVFVAYSIISILVVRTKLIKLNFPEFYIKATMLAGVLRIATLILFIFFFYLITFNRTIVP